MRLMEPPDGRPWLLIGLFAVSVALNVVLVSMLWSAPDDSVTPAQDGVEAQTGVADMDGEANLDPEEVGMDPATEEPEVAPVDPNLEVIRVDVVHSLARTFQRAAPDRGDAISAVYARLFAWDLDLRRDLQAGDQVGVVFDATGEHPEVHGATYASQKLGETFRAYRFQAEGDLYPSWWDAEGQEVPRRLKRGPIEHYAQVTALLKDRPSHKGMDFKADEGAPVLAARPAVVTRVNWNVANNGNCVELRYNDGVMARMLHLSEVDVRVGQSVDQGALVGKVGNTGRSTAAHLHYEIDRGGKVLDPVDYHGVERRNLTESDLKRMRLTQARVDELMASSDEG